MKVPKFEPAEAVLSGETTDIYFARTIDILRREGLNPVATMQVFPNRGGILAGLNPLILPLTSMR